MATSRPLTLPIREMDRRSIWGEEGSGIEERRGGQIEERRGEKENRRGEERRKIEEGRGEEIEPS